jgi:copper chaperone
MSQTTLKVAGMGGERCADSVEGALRNIGAEGHVNLATNTVTVHYDENQVSVNNIKNAIEEQGYRIV